VNRGSNSDAPQRLKRALNLCDLLIYGMITTKVEAPIPIFGFRI